MAMSLRNKKVEELARHLAFERSKSITDAILEALETRLNQLGPIPRVERDLSIIEHAVQRITALPNLSEKTIDQIIGYDQDGLPT